MASTHKTAFISYSYEDRAHGAQAKKTLSSVGFRVFLAHDDLEVTDEWRTRTLEELQRCDLFIPLLSEHLVRSLWAPQELGFIVSRLQAGVIVAPLSLDGTRSFGFISHIQSPQVSTAGIDDKILIQPLARRLPRQILPTLIARAAKARSYRHAEELVEPLVALFSMFTAEEAQSFAEAVVANGQIWDAALCRNEYLPEFILAQRSNIQTRTLRALEYQIEQGGWYNVSENPDEST